MCLLHEKLYFTEICILYFFFNELNFLNFGFVKGKIYPAKSINILQYSLENILKDMLENMLEHIIIYAQVQI